MKRIRSHPLLAGWLAAILLWLLVWLGGGVQTLFYLCRGQAGTQQLAPDDWALSSLVETENPVTGEDGWLVSTDTDPRVEWTGERYVSTVTITLSSLRTTGAVVMYYKTPGQTDYSVQQMVYAQKTGEATYEFSLGGQYVTALRIDPASSGAVFLKPGTAVIDPPGSWLRRLVPNGLQWMALLAAGPVLAALWRLVDNKGYKTKE